MQRLADQVALVTGGAQGIGGATARRLAEEGSKVLIADIDMETASKNVDPIRQVGGTAEAFHADVREHQDIKAMVERAAKLWDRLDILVNNAYSSLQAFSGGALEVTEDGWDKGMDLLVKSIFLGAKYAVPKMRNQAGGNIVNMSSSIPPP